LLIFFASTVLIDLCTLGVCFFPLPFSWLTYNQGPGTEFDTSTAALLEHIKHGDIFTTRNIQIHIFKDQKNETGSPDFFGSFPSPFVWYPLRKQFPFVSPNKSRCEFSHPDALIARCLFNTIAVTRPTTESLVVGLPWVTHNAMKAFLSFNSVVSRIFST
jgi:hypothetical protein